jgi:AcrR family transcriptional regulator
MGRRSDHGRAELRELILSTGQEVMAEGGYARFSAREVAKRVGYSVGTIMHIFGNVDLLVMAINSRTFGLWAQWIEARLEGAEGRERIAVLVEGYFDFAAGHGNLWAAIYEHRVPESVEMTETLVAERVRLTDIIRREVGTLLPGDSPERVARLTSSLIATVHGHCAFALGGSFALMGEVAPLELAVARVMEVLQANSAALDA